VLQRLWPAANVRDISPDDVEKIDSGWAVELIERWRGTFVGDRLVRAGVDWHCFPFKTLPKRIFLFYMLEYHRRRQASSFRWPPQSFFCHASS
jgi:hypothetical protein